jgi:hypothetical protein
MKRICLALVLVVSLSAPAWADFEEGVAAYDRGDYATALREWKPLAEAGMRDAQHNLGVMYHQGEGVPQDYGEAVKWYRRAAEAGIPEAQFNLGLMYDQGYGVPQDYGEAMKWYRRAAEQGHADAQLNLGFMYDDGRGVPQDYVQAHMWSNLAASRFAPGSNRDMAVKNRDIVAERMTPAQIAEAQRLAREWKPKSE